MFSKEYWIALPAGALLALLAFPQATGGPASRPGPDEQRRALLEAAPRVNPLALGLALETERRARQERLAHRPGRLALIDFSRPSTEPRLWVFDLEANRLLFEERVAHGKNSGGNLPVAFSNQPGSYMSSLGVFVTGETYQGRHGYSLRLEGLEPGINCNSRARAIVIHAADYVSEEFVRRTGRLGRSWGCPAVRPEISRELIDTIKNGAVLFAYYPDKTWLSTSRFAPVETAVQPKADLSRSEIPARGSAVPTTAGPATAEAR